MKNLHPSLILRVLLASLFLFSSLGVMHLGAQTGTDAEAYETILHQEFGTYSSGATAIVTRNGELLYRGAIGMADIELGVKAKPEHVFRIGSITKQFTAVAVLQLEEQGRLSVTDPITKYIPDYPTQGRTITIEHLLTHTSGIKSYTGMSEFAHVAGKDLTPMEIVDVFKDQPMEFEPGEKFYYNNYGYILLGVIIENVSGMSFADYLQQNIFEPLGMSHSCYGDDTSLVSMRAAGYQQKNGLYADADFLNMTLPYAAGALLSNVDDLNKWNQALHTNKVLSQKSLKKAMTAYTLNDGSSSSYGYGWKLGEIYNQPVEEHDGVIQGFLSAAMYLPKEKVFIAVFSNCECKDPWLAANKMAAYTIGELPALASKEQKEIDLSEYTGIYEISEDRAQKITTEGQQLYVTYTGGERHEVYSNPKKADQFFFEDGLMSIHFVRDEAGKVAMAQTFQRGSLQGEAVRSSEVLAVQKAIQVDAELLEEYAGTYDMGPFKLSFTVENGKIFGQPGGASKEELFAKGNDQFFLKTVDARVEFVRNNNEVTGVKLFQGNRALEGKLLAETKIVKQVSFSPLANTSDLKEYTGVYESDGRRLTVTLEEDFLYGQPEGDSKEKMEPKGEDKFEVTVAGENTIQVTFLREEGSVSHIKLLMPDGNEITAKKIK